LQSAQLKGETGIGQMTQVRFSRCLNVRSRIDGEKKTWCERKSFQINASATGKVERIRSPLRQDSSPLF